MAQSSAGYGGQGFSLRGEKGRFVLPPTFRNKITELSDQRVLCLARHSRWPCLTAFGTERPGKFEDELDREEIKSTKLGKEFDRELASLQLWSFTEIPFDASGRFIMPDTLSQLGKIEGEVYFQGIGPSFTLWNPAQLQGMGAGFEGAQAYCADMAAKIAKGAKAKGGGK